MGPIEGKEEEGPMEEREELGGNWRGKRKDQQENIYNLCKTDPKNLIWK